jgi:glycosyltransferase EpsE
MPKISVIMGIYNCASTLQEALDSLYAQTYQDFEIILCEDGSKDNTYEIALENQKQHDNIVLLRNPYNMGLNQTLNNCLAVAQGEYIARMDGDDICDSTRFEKQVKFLDKHPEYAIVSSPMIYFDETGEFFRGKIKEGEANKEYFNYGSPFCHAPSMVRKEAFIAVNGYTIDKRLLRIEDYNLWAKMYEKGYKGYNLGEYLYMMRDDRNASKRRTLRARCNGIYAHWLAYRRLDLSFLLFLRYAINVLIRGLMPTFLYDYLRHKIKK